MNFKAVLALPKKAGSAQTYKSISFIWIVWSTLYVYLWITPKSEPKYVYFHQKLSIKLILDISNVRNQIFFSNVLWLHFCYWTSILLHLKAILSFKRLQANCVLSSKIEKKVILDTYFQCKKSILFYNGCTLLLN